MHTLFITNSRSGRKKRANEIADRVNTYYKDELEAVEVWEVDFEQLDQKLVDFIAGGGKNIYAVGGDGTVNAIGSRLIGSPINFGVIPTGSGNGYARNLGFSIKTALAVKQTKEAEPILVDAAKFNDIPFLNIAGVGIGAEVAKNYASTQRRGLAPYVKKSAASFLSYNPQSYDLYLDGEHLHLDQIMGIEIANGTQWGYEAKAAPLASLTDGLLDVVVIKQIPLIEVAGVVAKLFRGKVTRSKHIDIYRAKEIRIMRAEAGAAQVDGEPFEAGREIVVKIQEKALNLLLPNTLTAKKVASL